MLREKDRINLFVISCFIASILFLSGCSLIADYDPIIDQTVSSLHNDVNVFLTKMERSAGTPEGEYINNTQFYDKLIGTLESLRTRGAIIPKNDIILAQINLLRNNIEKLRIIHERHGQSGLSKVLIDPIKVSINNQFSSIIKLQNALKRGEAVQ